MASVIAYDVKRADFCPVNTFISPTTAWVSGDEWILSWGTDSNCEPPIYRTNWDPPICPQNALRMQPDGVYLNANGRPVYSFDKTSGKYYLYMSSWTLRSTAITKVITLPFEAAWNMATRILKLVTLHHFWQGASCRGANTQPYALKNRLLSAVNDTLKCIATPFATVALELAALYTMLATDNGRKLYATISRAVYGKEYCFTPDSFKARYLMWQVNIALQMRAQTAPAMQAAVAR